MTADEIDALLPQTQCTRCGFPGCLPYAQALMQGAAAINRCPPGGNATIQALATVLRREPLPLDPACGIERPAAIAFIDESRCIGCAKCLAPCPVDAILGAARLMHTVIAELCTGCELCVAPCPVDCIVMVPRDAANEAHREPAPASNRARFENHKARDARRAGERAALLSSRKLRA